MGSFNTPNDLFNRTCVPNRSEDLNLSVFDAITGINKSKTLTKHIPRKCDCKFDGSKCNSNQNLYNNKCRCKCASKTSTM